MNNDRQIGVVIVAAGTGSRFGGNIPKQYCCLGNKPVVMHAIERFRETLPDSETVIVVSSEMVEFWQQLCRDYGFESPRIVTGGASRSESVRNGIEALSLKKGTVMVHDGARPLVDPQTILNVAEAMEKGVDGALPVVPVTDTIREITEAGQSVTVDRGRYRAVQTPQAFDLEKLTEAYSLTTGTSFTDDAGAMEAAGYTDIRMVDGNVDNIKITNPRDIAIAEAILNFKTR